MVQSAFTCRDSGQKPATVYKPIGRGQVPATVLIVDTLPVAHLEYLASEHTV
jgi:hypothetical protein